MRLAPVPAGVATERWIGIGHSTVSDACRAGMPAADEALELAGIRERSGRTSEGSTC